MSSELKLVRNNFNQAASNYSQKARIQQFPARQILNRLNQNYQDGLILDLGSGPGTFIHAQEPNWLPSSVLLLYDLSLAMLKNRKQVEALAINGDAADLPFAAASIPLIISNLMLQWPTDKQQVFNEISRVLTKNGKIIFSTLIEGSLWQLKHAWQKIDNFSHTLHFHTQDDYRNLCQIAGLTVLEAETSEKIVYFKNLKELIQHFKQTGTSLPKSQSGAGLASKETFKRLEKAYQEHANEQGLALSYNYLIITAGVNTLSVSDTSVSGTSVPNRRVD